MALPRARISKKILDEIDRQIKDEIVRELAKNLLQFELENWRIEKPHYKDFFVYQLTIHTRKRMKRP